MVRLLPLLVGASCLWGPSAEEGPFPIRELKRDVTWLASDALRGRGTATPELERAADYIAMAFGEAGLVPLPGNDDFFAPFSLYPRGFDPAGCQLTIGTEAFPPRGDWRPFGFSEAGTVKGPVVFAGYGITAEEFDWDDYANLDVAGKIVLILRHEPGEADADSRFAGTEQTAHATFRRKAANAKAHGAVGMLLVTDPLHHEASEDLSISTSYRLKPPEPKDPVEAPFLSAHLSPSLAAALLGDHDLAELQRAIDRDGPLAAPLDGVQTATLTVARGRADAPIRQRNVVGMLPGREAPDEWVVIGAHYDHLRPGGGEGDTIYNGADDNASGTAGLLALARAFARRESPLPRSIVFQAYAAEEEGLLGSRAWVRDNQVDHVVLMVNLDMIGRHDGASLKVMGDGYATELTELAQAALAEANVSGGLGGTEYAPNSDHHPFHEQHRPVLFFFTGLHDDYHQVTDHVEKIAFGRMRRIVHATQLVVEPVAERTVTPRPIFRYPWWGAALLDGQVIEVDARSRAATSGVQVGDHVVRVGAEQVDATSAGPAIGDIPRGGLLSVGFRRGENTVTIDVVNVGPGYLGIYPGRVEGDGETAGVRVSRLVADGPAAEAGMQQGDVIRSIGGEEVTPGILRALMARLGAGAEVDVVVERDGTRHTFPLKLGSATQ